jgi:hypothetical protein
MPTTFFMLNVLANHDAPFAASEIVEDRVGIRRHDLGDGFRNRLQNAVRHRLVHIAVGPHHGLSVAVGMVAPALAPDAHPPVLDRASQASGRRPEPQWDVLPCEALQVGDGGGLVR